MKKSCVKNILLVLLMIILLLSSCIGCEKSSDKDNLNGSTTAVDESSASDTNATQSDKSDREYLKETVSVVEVDKYSVDYEKIEFPIEFEADVLELVKPVKTDEEAKSVAIDILEKCHEQGKWLDDTLVGILHSTEDNVWRFEYSLDQSDVPIDELVDGSVSYVVIDGNSGELIAAWAEE